MKLVALMCDSSDAETADKVAKSILCVFDFEGNSGVLLRFAISREIRTTSKKMNDLCRLTTQRRFKTALS